MGAGGWVGGRGGVSTKGEICVLFMNHEHTRGGTDWDLVRLDYTLFTPVSIQILRLMHTAISSYTRDGHGDRKMPAGNDWKVLKNQEGPGNV